jgi:predicted oxidoreductase/DNA repair photolyase
MKNQLIFGTWQLSDKFKTEADFSITEKEQLLLDAWDAGIDVYDTAPVYGNGSVHALLSAIIPKAKFITKIPALGKPRLDVPQLNVEDYYPDWHIEESIEVSLSQLGSIDTILLHNWHPLFSPELINRLREIACSYGIRNIGISLPNSSITVPKTVVEKVDSVMLNYQFLDSTLEMSPDLVTSQDKILYRSIFKQGQEYDPALYQKFNNSKVVVGMTSKKQLYQNIKSFGARNHIFSTPETVSNLGPRTGIKYEMLKLTYGSLATTGRDPLISVSHAHSSISIDPWIGCPLKCAYCHVQGTDQDLVDGKMPVRAIKRSNHTLEEILDRLEVSPFYNDKIPLSIGTSSTEPLNRGYVLESTLEIMEKAILRGMKNPFWIVTKYGYMLDEKQHERMKKIIETNPVLISFCYAGNPSNIEPASNYDRFRGIERFKQIGGVTAWYMRPMAYEWNGKEEQIEKMICEVSAKYPNAFDMIVPGGLRWTEGIEYGMVEVHNQPMPTLDRGDNVKSLDQEAWLNIVNLVQRYFPQVPVYKKSSCMISYAFKRPSITLVNYLESHACKQCSICPAWQRELCDSKKVTEEQIKEVYESYNLIPPDEAVSLETIPFDKQDYLTNQAILHGLGEG